MNIFFTKRKPQFKGKKEEKYRKVGKTIVNQDNREK